MCFCFGIWGNILLAQLFCLTALNFPLLLSVLNVLYIPSILPILSILSILSIVYTVSNASTVYNVYILSKLSLLSILWDGLLSKCLSCLSLHLMIKLLPDIPIPHHHTIPYHTIPYHTIPYCTIPYHGSVQ